MDNIRQKVFSNLLWRFAERMGAQLVQFVVSIILARILAPEAYGVVALITVFTSILQVFVDSGLGNALIQKKKADQLDFSTVFYTNIIFCVTLYIALFFLAPALADFYDQPSMVWLIRVLGVTVLISGIKNVQQAYVSRNMLFRKFFYATLLGTVLAAIVGIVMAYKGFGAWALVAQQVLNVTVDTIVLWIIVKWRPTRQFSFQRLKTLFSYGWKLLVSSLIDATYNNARQLVIGKVYSTEDLAYYNRAKQMPNLLVENVNSSIDSVLLPSMSSVQDKRDMVKSMTRRAIKTSMFIMAPLMIGLAAVANNLVVTLLTEKWLPCVPFLMILSVYYMFWPIHTANLNAIKALGRSDIFLKLEVAKKVAGVAILIVSLRFGPLGIAFGMLAEGVVSLAVNMWPNRKILKYGYIEQIRDIIRPVILAIIMGLAISAFNFLNLPALPTLALQVMSGIGIYIVGAKVMKIDSLNYVKTLFFDIVSKKRKQSA